MHSPIIEVIINTGEKVFELFVSLTWWHPVNRDMAKELYYHQHLENPIKCFRNERQWLISHKVSKWVWVDYIGGMVKSSMLLALIVTLIVICSIARFA